MPGANPGLTYPPGTGLASPYQLALAAKQAGFPLSQIPTAVAVALAESKGQINAAGHNSNGTVDHGAWQINDINLGPGGVAAGWASNINNLQANANAAHAIWKSSGWGAWTTHNTGAYKTYWAQGLSAANQASASTANQALGAALPLAGLAAGLGFGGAAAGAAADAAAADTAAAGAGGAGGGAGLSGLAQAVQVGGAAAALAGIWQAITGDAKYAAVLVLLLVVGGLMIVRGLSPRGAPA